MAKGGFTLVGEKALQKRLARISKKSTLNRMARPALRQASGEIRKVAKFYAQASKDTGLLVKSIKNVVRTGRSGVYAVIGPAYGFKRIHPSTAQYSVVRYQDPAKYAHLVEFGTVHSAPKPYLRPAYDSVNSKAIIAKRLAKELDKEAAKKR